jgi:hypothetical protein
VGVLSREQVFGVVLLSIFIFTLIRVTWYHIFVPIKKERLRSGSSIVGCYLIMVGATLGYIGLGLFLFYLGGYWKLIPFSILIIFYYLIIKIGKI